MQRTAVSLRAKGAGRALRFPLQGYYREGVALQCLGRHAEALAAFSSGLAQVSHHTTTQCTMGQGRNSYNFESVPPLYYSTVQWATQSTTQSTTLHALSAQDPKSLQLLAGLVEAAMKSPLKGAGQYTRPWHCTTMQALWSPPTDSCRP
jgi:hypothetical protein